LLLVLAVRADWDEIFFFNSKFSNLTAEGDDNRVAHEATYSSLASGVFPEKSDAFEVASCAGLCQNTATSCSSGYKTGLCPGPSNIKCCPMSTPSCSGQCQDTSLSCGTGYQTGKCPGASNMKCCPSSGGGGGGGGGGVPPGTSAQRKGIYDAAMALYNNRAHEHYTQGSQRWIGITDKVRPPSAPTYSDCSAAATWCYWTVFGSGADFLNGQNWKAGYTGTMSSHGHTVSCSSMAVGDLSFYGHPISHVAISIGNGKVVSHGSDPVGIYSYNYRSDLNQCRTYF